MDSFLVCAPQQLSILSSCNSDGCGSWGVCSIWSAVAKVRNLVDVNKNGVLDADYFAVAMHLTMKTKRGQPLPESLTPELIPPAHR